MTHKWMFVEVKLLSHTGCSMFARHRRIIHITARKLTSDTGQARAERHHLLDLPRFKRQYFVRPLYSVRGCGWTSACENPPAL